MSDLYTDADVQAAAYAIADHGSRTGHDQPRGHVCIARDALNAVAPAIAARALRDAADDSLRATSGIWMAPADRVWLEWLRDRADEIEARP